MFDKEGFYLFVTCLLDRKTFRFKCIFSLGYTIPFSVCDVLLIFGTNHEYVDFFLYDSTFWLMDLKQFPRLIVLLS